MTPQSQSATTVAVSDMTSRLTYHELAAARGITLDAARRMAQRHKWAKQVGNDGLSRVEVPVSALVPTEPSRPVEPRIVRFDSATVSALADAVAAATVAGVVASTGDATHVVQALEAAITALRDQLAAEQERVRAAEQRLQEVLTTRRSWWRRK